MENYSRRNNFGYLTSVLTIVITIVLLLFLGSNSYIGGLNATPTTSAAYLLKTILLPSVKITFPPAGQHIPVGNNITIFGTSKYNMTYVNNCAVYANVNNYKFEKATSVGPHGNNDYSSWMYTYVNNNLPITKGINSLNVKLSCNRINGANMTMYNATRVVGVPEVNNNRNQYYYYNYNNNNNNNLFFSQGTGSLLARNNNNNNPAGSSPTFWFLGPSNDAAAENNNNINGINSNSNTSSSSSNTKSIQSVQQQPNYKALNISIRVLNDSVVWGNERTVKISVVDRTSGQPISNAIVTGNIVSFPTGKTGLLKSFVLLTNNSGEASYSWLVPYINTTDSNYKISISAYAQGYNSAAISGGFNGMSYATNNNDNSNFVQNKNSNNNNNNVPPNNESPQVSTIRTS